MIAVVADHELSAELAELVSEDGWVVGVAWEESASGPGFPATWWARRGDLSVAATSQVELAELIRDLPL